MSKVETYVETVNYDKVDELQELFDRVNAIEDDEKRLEAAKNLTGALNG